MDDNKRWSLVVARDQSADGAFIYAVKTTRCFCRPICKARLPRRSNVEFFDTPAQAQAAQYRACKRCKPLLPSYNPEADKIKKACDLLDSLPQNAPLPGLDRLAKEAGLTKHHFHRLFKRETGITPREYALQRRRKSESEATDSTAMTPLTPFGSDFHTPVIVTEDAFDSFDSQQVDMLDMLKFPSSQELRNVVIYYDIIETSFGLLLLGFQNRQLCKTELGTNEKELMQLLESEYPPLYYFHSNVALADATDAALFQQQTCDVIDGLESQGNDLFDFSLFAEPTVATYIT